MNGRLVSRIELQDRLARAGQSSWNQGSGELDINSIFPPDGAYITVGAELDPTLKLEFRGNYYLCLRISPEEPVPALFDEPGFEFSEEFEEAQRKLPCSHDFIEGPFRWLLRQLFGFEQILLWPARGGSSDQSVGFSQPRLLDKLPALGKRLATESPDLATLGAIVLDLVDVDDCMLLWEVAGFLSTATLSDWYVSDQDCHEVYLMHHHDKVIIAVPDPGRRGETLADLVLFEDVIANHSNYRFESDQ